MCGIAGFVDFTGTLTMTNLIGMTDTLYHRGPDDSGYTFHKDNLVTVALGHRRLSILDLSLNGHQPMKYDSIELIYNGEIYNFEKIKEELLASGYEFDSRSDTEVVLKAFHKWGIKSFNKLNGMFAIVIFDRKKNLLYIARDKLGIKPLYYYHKEEKFIFASEIKSFNVLNEGKNKLNKSVLHEFMQYRFIENPSTFLKDIKIFPPGVCCVIDNKEVKYFNIEYIAPVVKRLMNDADTAELLLLEAIEKQMISDVPLGFFLSGGLDSSLLVSIASKVFNKKVSTFSVSFENYEYSEKYFQRLVVNDSKTDHYNFTSNHTNFIKDYILTTSNSNSPHLIPNFTQIFQLSTLAKDIVKVLMSGEGADEVFGGYHRFSNARLYKLASSFQLTNLFKLAGTLRDNYKDFSSTSENDLYLKQMSYASVEDIAQFTSFNNFKKRSLKKGAQLNDLLLFDQATYLHGLLARVDSMSMLAGVEARVPYLDFNLVAFVNQLEFEKKVGFRSRKKILYKIAEKYVPKEIISRSKVGFPLPLEKWLTEDFGIGKLKYILLDDRSKERCYLNQIELKKILSNTVLIKRYSESIIFPLLSLELWIRFFLENDDPEEYFQMYQ